MDYQEVYDKISNAQVPNPHTADMAEKLRARYLYLLGTTDKSANHEMYH